MRGSEPWDRSRPIFSKPSGVASLSEMRRTSVTPSPLPWSNQSQTDVSPARFTLRCTWTRARGHRRAKCYIQPRILPSVMPGAGFRHLSGIRGEGRGWRGEDNGDPRRMFHSHTEDSSVIQANRDCFGSFWGEKLWRLLLQTYNTTRYSILPTYLLLQ